MPTSDYRVEHSRLEVPRTAHCYALGAQPEATERLWIVLHGYGQAADSFIHKFSGLADERTRIIAPEALSRFYWQGFAGEVGASWMTRKDRLDEIEDCRRYLSHVLAHCQAQMPRLRALSVLGFSQGVATALRWLHQERPALLRHLVLWAGLLPDDVDLRSALPYWQAVDKHWAYGLQDEFLSPDRLAAHERLIAQAGWADWKAHVFDGPHHIDRAVLHDLVAGLAPT